MATHRDTTIDAIAALRALFKTDIEAAARVVAGAVEDGDARSFIRRLLLVALLMTADRDAAEARLDLLAKAALVEQPASR